MAVAGYAPKIDLLVLPIYNLHMQIICIQINTIVSGAEYVGTLCPGG